MDYLCVGFKSSHIMTRSEAESQLQNLFGFTKFHDLQWEVIEQLFDQKRILLIEKTGFGKSLCFQFPATQFPGITIVFSPLIALMRDQVRSMLEKGIRAAAIHSNHEADENEAIIQKAQHNQLDLLYIAPERMENAAWIVAAREMKISMIVVDEAHCISIWGQNFRPNYRRIVNLVKLLPKNFPVLATTATATARVQEDIIEQVGSDLIPVRGQLMRPNISLNVVKVKSEDEKFYWLAQYLHRIPKPGIIYTGTVADTETYSNWIQFLGFKSSSYNGRLDAETRIRVETGFFKNEFDCVVATNALGMGIDKPDIRFIIHTQITQSPIHYYQEIGRAGRDGEKAYAILLYNPDEDQKLPKSFIEGTKPSPANYEKVISVVRKELLARNEIIKAVNLKQTQVNVILADLIDQGIVREQQAGKSKKYFYAPGAPLFNHSKFEKLRDIQIQELEKMVEYVDSSQCRMHYLCEYLGDPEVATCRICDVDKNYQLSIQITDSIKDKLEAFREIFFPVLEVETKRSNIVNGVAGSYYGVTNVGTAIKHSKYEGGGDFPDWLLRLTLKAFKIFFDKQEFDMIVFVPPTESGDLVKNFSEKVSESLKIPVSYKLRKTHGTSPQKMFHSALSKKDNVKNSFEYIDPSELTGKRILLIDDIFDSGCTIKEIGEYLTRHGATMIAPLVIAKTVGGDI